jgi:regulator of sirC expression with transglutaminase-like and TPR domain
VRARVYAGLHDNAVAKRSIRKSLELDPQRPEHWRALALLMIETRDYSDAIEAIEKFLELRPDNQDAQTKLIELQQMVPKAVSTTSAPS